MIKRCSHALFALLFLVFGFFSTAQAADNYPDRKVVSLIVPYPAGGASDASARIFNGPIGESLGQTVIVENIGGATGAIAGNRLLSLPADGYQIFHGSPNGLILPSFVNSAVEYEPEQFELVHAITDATLVVLVREGLGVDSLDDLLEMARDAADQPLTYGTVGTGSLYHLIGEKISQDIGAPLEHIAYRGAAPAITDLAAGSIDFAILAFQVSMLGLQDEGRLKIISSLSNELPEPLKDIPTISESTIIGDYDYSIPGGYFVKEGTPVEIKEKLNEAVAYALEQPEVRKQLESEGRIVQSKMSVEESQTLWDAEIEKLRDLVEEIGFEPI